MCWDCLSAGGPHSFTRMLCCVCHHADSVTTSQCGSGTDGQIANTEVVSVASCAVNPLLLQPLTPFAVNLFDSDTCKAYGCSANECLQTTMPCVDGTPSAGNASHVCLPQHPAAGAAPLYMFFHLALAGVGVYLSVKCGHRGSAAVCTWQRQRTPAMGRWLRTSSSSRPPAPVRRLSEPQPQLESDGGDDDAAGAGVPIGARPSDRAEAPLLGASPRRSPGFGRRSGNKGRLASSYEAPPRARASPGAGRRHGSLAHPTHMHGGMQPVVARQGTGGLGAASAVEGRSMSSSSRRSGTSYGHS